MSWLKAIALTDITVGQTRAITVQDEELLLCRVSENEVYAVENLCSHDDGPLTEGSLTSTMIECPRHGARFDVTTGAVTRLPAASPLLTFPTRFNKGWIEVAVENGVENLQSNTGEDA